jgi:DNA polymerase elongation subunit (family B)
MEPFICHLSSCFSKDESITISGDSEVNADMRYVTYLFGRQAKTNKSVCIITEDYTPYFYISVPHDAISTDFKNDMVSVVDNYANYLSNHHGRDYLNSVIKSKCGYVYRKQYRGYSKGKMIKLLRLTFKNEKMMKACGYYLNKQKNRVNICERHPIPRSFIKSRVYDEMKFDNLHKMFHTRNINPAGWIVIKNGTLTTDRTKQDIEILTSYQDLFPLEKDNEYGLDPDAIMPFISLSYDGEMNSCDGLVPQHQRDTDEIIQIGTIFRKFGDKSSYKKIMVTQKKCAPLKTPNVIVIECNNERELLRKWAKIIEKINPDIIYGYNTFGFDDEYIYKRAEKLKCEKELLKTLSRCRHWNSEYRIKELTSSGLGQNIFKYLEIPGRINLDVMLEIKKNVAFKFPTYTLNYVSNYFIGDKKDDLDPHELFAKYQRGTPEDMAIISDYCVKDCELVHDLVDKLAIIPSNVGMARVCHVVIDYIISRGQGIKILSLLSHFIMQSPPDDRYILEYQAKVVKKPVGGAIVLYPKIGIYNKDPVVVIDFNSLYPSIMIAKNLSHDTILLNDKYKEETKFQNLHYFNKETSEKTYVEFLAYDENRSNMGLLPRLLEKLLKSRKIKKNKMALVADHIAIIKKCINYLDDDNMVEKLRNDIEGKLETDIQELRIDKETSQFTLHYNGMSTTVPIDNYQNVINRLSLQQSVLNALQMADKVTCNSVYGQTSAPTSALYLPEIGSVVTTMGQHYIQLSKKHAEDKYGADCVYGDTDSIFIKFPIDVPDAENKTPQEIKIAKLLEAKRLGYQISDEITNMIGEYPMKIAYEKAILPLILMGKKNYCGLWHEEDIYKSKFKMMGCKAKKREYAPIVNKLFTSIVDKIVYADNYERALELAVKDFYKKCQVLHKYPHKYFVITKSVKRDYKNIPMQKILANRIAERDPGSAPKPNSRVGYIFIDPGDPLEMPIEKLGSTGQKKKAKGSTSIHKDDILKGHRIETPKFIKENNLSIDFEEYISAQIAVPIISILRLEIPLHVIEYMISDLLGGKNVNVKIKQNKRIIYTTGEEEITESAQITVLKSNKNQKSYVFKESDLKYIKFISSFKRDLASGRIQIISG